MERQNVQVIVRKASLPVCKMDVEKLINQETSMEDFIYHFNSIDKTVQNMDEEGKELPETSYSFRKCID